MLYVCLIRHISPFADNVKICVLVFVVLWDISRLIHLLYRKQPGFHTEVHLAVDACLYFLDPAYLCRPCPEVARVGIYGTTVPLMYVRSSRPVLAGLTFTALVSFLSTWITIWQLLRYSSRRRQRHEYFTPKPTLAFTSLGNPVAVYLNENAPVPLHQRIPSLNSLLSHPETRQAERTAVAAES